MSPQSAQSYLIVICFWLAHGLNGSVEITYLSLYNLAGVTENYALNTLRSNGFSAHYSVPYSDVTKWANINPPPSARWIFFGCRASGSSNMKIGVSMPASRSKIVGYQKTAFITIIRKICR